MRYLFGCLLLASILNACSSKLRDENLVWSDEFNNDQTTLSQKWNIETGNGCPELCGFGNNELQYYKGDKQNLKIEDGKLIITAVMHKGDSGFTSSKLTSKNKGDWQYGYFEVRAMLPKGVGTWPAIWMLPTQDKPLEWPLDGEIDIMEHVGYNQGTIYGTIHTKAYNGMIGTQKSDSIFIENTDSQFHTYAVDWQENYISWLVDGEIYHTLQRNNDDDIAWPFAKPFHLILNLAVGGNWGGKYGVDHLVFPQEMKIDYVRVYNQRPIKE